MVQTMGCYAFFSFSSASCVAVLWALVKSRQADNLGFKFSGTDFGESLVIRVLWDVT